MWIGIEATDMDKDIIVNKDIIDKNKICIKYLDSSTDHRGVVEHINEVSLEPVKRIYIVENHVPGFIRAWHGHLYEGKFALMLNGSALLIAIPLICSETGDSTVYNFDISKAAIIPMIWRPRTLVWIPPNHVHGYKLLTVSAQIMFLSTATLEESKADDIRISSSIGRELWNVPER